jgi:hypothetical protein
MACEATRQDGEEREQLDMRQAVLATVGILFVILWGIHSGSGDPLEDFDPAPPVEAASLAGETLYCNTFLLGTSPTSVMVVSPTDGGCERVADVVGETWERAGWETDVVAGTGGATVSGSRDDVTYAVEIRPCAELPDLCGTTFPDDDVLVRVWRVE